MASIRSVGTVQTILAFAETKQVRGLDIDNVSFIESKTTDKVIIVDPTSCYETAKKAIELYLTYRENKTIGAMIFSHCHGDHFGGGAAVLELYPDVQIYAPEGFWEHAVSEWVYAGTAMLRRALYMYGESLEKKPDGQIGCGLGQLPAAGRTDLPRPHFIVDKYPKQAMVIKEVDIEVVFQLTPNTEAPAEMNFFFPDFGALCMAENACHNLHNIQTLRGATVRDARQWSRYLDEAIVHFGDKTDVVFASHHWPTWDNENVLTFLSSQRDMYAYLHDQTLRMLNNGMTGLEIAEKIELPTALDKRWHLRGYYGSVSHNVKGIYHRYMGWYDGNPAHLWEHPPVQAAKRYVDCMGGMRAVVEKARKYVEEKDLRFAATLLGHAVFADQEHETAKEELACVYEQLAYGAENATWRNIYLVGAQELRGDIHLAVHEVLTAQLEIDQLIDTMSIRLDGMKAQNDPFFIEAQVTDKKAGWLMTLSNGALTHHQVDWVDVSSTRAEPPPTTSSAPKTANGSSTAPPKLTIWLTHMELVDLVSGDLVSGDRNLDGLTCEGDKDLLWRLFGYLTDADAGFAIVTPEKPAK